jgi:chromatin remodeling complex protein RSC6
MAKKANSAFMKPLTPSSSLAEVVGAKPLPRSEVVKKMWVYIKKNGLQKQVSMFEMNKHLAKHLK